MHQRNKSVEVRDRKDIPYNIIVKSAVDMVNKAMDDQRKLCLELMKNEFMLNIVKVKKEAEESAMKVLNTEFENQASTLKQELNAEKRKELSVARFIYDNYEKFTKGYYKGKALMNFYNEWRIENNGEEISNNQRVMPRYMKLYCYNPDDEDKSTELPDLDDPRKLKRYHVWRVNKLKTEMKNIIDKNNSD